MDKTLKIGRNNEHYYVYRLKDSKKSDVEENRIISARYQTRAEARRSVSEAYKARGRRKPFQALLTIVLILVLLGLGLFLAESFMKWHVRSVLELHQTIRHVFFK